MATGQEITLYNLVMHADPVVKGVMGGLALASVACWALVVEKSWQLFRLKREIRDLEGVAESGGFTGKGQETGRLLPAVRSALTLEASEGGSADETRNDVRARFERAMRGALKRELQRIETGLPFLATIGSAAPFIGLFGTVWGIMNSFTSIAQQKDTSLAVVAPGIAEALFATALGLVAAIPAVMAYNHFAVQLGRASERAGTSIALIAKRLARGFEGSDKVEPMPMPMRRSV